MKRWITGVLSFLVVASILVWAGFAVLNKLDEPKGMYVQYGDVVYEAENEGMRIEHENTITLTIKHVEDWGLYNVRQCKVKVLPNTTEACNIPYTVGDSDTEYYFSRLTDVSAAFMENYAEYNGTGLQVDEKGNVQLYFDKDYTMATAISRVRGGERVQVAQEVDMESYPYFILQITSPNGQEVIKLPFTLKEIKGKVLGVEFDKTQLVF